MWPDAYSKPADSDPDYTLDCEEPLKVTLHTTRMGLMTHVGR